MVNIENVRELKVGYHTWSFASLPLEEALKHARDAGFTEVEINANKRHMDPRIYPRQTLPQLRRLLKDLSLQPHSVHAPIEGINLSTSNPAERRRSVRLLTEMLEYCSIIECPIVVVHPNHSENLTLGNEVMKRNSVESLEEIAPEAEDLGVKIALENMTEKEKRRFGSRVVDLIELIEDVESPQLGVCLDIGHANLIPGHEVSLEDEITLADKHLWTLHVHDNDGITDRHWPPGDGNIDWNQVVRGLRKTNYRSVFMMEVQERGDPDELAKRSLKKTMEILGQ